MIWLHSYEELEVFLARLNQFHEKVKFTWEIAYDRISFVSLVLMCRVSRRMPISTLTLGRVTRRTSRGGILMDNVYGLR